MGGFNWEPLNLLGSLFIAPVSEHGGVAAGAQLTHLLREGKVWKTEKSSCYLSHANSPPIMVDHFHLLVVHGIANGAGLEQHVVVGEALEGDRAGLSHAVGNNKVLHAKLVNDGLAKLLRARSSCHQASVQAWERGLFLPDQVLILQNLKQYLRKTTLQQRGYQ